MATLDELIDRYRITVEVRPGDAPPKEFPQATPYTVTLKRHGIGDPDPDQDIAPSWARDGMTLPFHMGPALEREPTAHDVLSCLLSDVNGYDSADGFEDWAEQYGYDPDSRKAEQIYEIIGEQRDELILFLSDTSTYTRVTMGRGGFALNTVGEHWDEFMESEEI